MTKREILVEGLQKNVMQIIFTKVDGQERVMHCTLHDSVLPETSIHSKQKNNDEVLPVWDIDIGAWRSFRLDSVKDVKVIKDIL